MARILIAGATGTLGRAAVGHLKAQGDFVRGLGRSVPGSRPKIRTIPPWLFGGLVAPVRLLNPRIHALMAFGAAVSAIDVVAPAVGQRDLRTYFCLLA